MRDWRGGHAVARSYRVGQGGGTSGQRRPARPWSPMDHGVERPKSAQRLVAAPASQGTPPPLSQPGKASWRPSRGRCGPVLTPGEPPSFVFVAGVPVRRRAHRGAAAPGGRGAARPTPRSALGAGWKPGGERAALPLRPLHCPPAGGLFMVLGMPGGKGRLRPWAEARLRAVGAGGAKP